MSRKIVVDTYTFTAAAKTIDMPSVSGLEIEGIQLITNVVDNVIIYQFNNPAKGGTLSGTTLTLTYDTTSMSDTDQLMIIYDSPADSVTQPVSVSGTVTVDGSGVTQPVSGTLDVNLQDGAGTDITSHNAGSSQGLDITIIDGSGNQSGITGNPLITEPTATITVPASGAGTAIAAAIVDASGNQITSFGGGTEYSVGSGAPTDPTGGTIVFENSSGNWENVGEGGGFGQPLPVDIKSSATVDVNIVSGSSSGVQYDEGDALGATPTGTVIVARKYTDDTASVPTTEAAGSRVPLHIIPLDANGDPRPSPTLYQQSDTSNTGDLAPGIAWKDADGSGSWHVTSITDPFPTLSYDSTLSNTVAMGSTSNAQTISDFNGRNTVGIQITGTWTGTLIFEGSVNATDWFTVSALPIGGTTVVTTATANGQWQADVSGFSDFRVRCSVVGTSTAVVDLRVSTATLNPVSFTPSTLLLDGSGNAIASSTSSPVGTERGLIVRNIPQTKADIASFTGSSQAITLTNIGGMSTAMIYISGTFSATVIPQVSVDNGTTYSNVSASPGIRRIFNYTSGGWVYEITAAGLYAVNIAGCNAFKLNCAAYTSGTVTAKCSVSNGSSIDFGRMNHVSVAISASSSGNNTIVGASSGNKIKVTSWNFMANGTVNAKFTDGAGGSDLTGLYYMIANTGISVPYNPEGYIITSTNTALVLNLSAAIAVGGVLTYTLCDNF